MSRDSARILGPEAQLLLCCSRSVPDSVATRRAQKLLAGEIDWTLLTRLALANRVTPLLRATLRATHGSAAPPELLEALQSHVQANQARGLALTRELLRILGLLEAAGVPALPFKGVTLAHRAYGDVGLRWAGDIDLLIRKEQLGAVQRALEARGFVEATELEQRRKLTASEQAWTLEHGCEYLYVRRGDGMRVEPHWALAPRRLAIAIDYDGFWQRATLLTLQGRTFSVFAVEDLMLALGVHGSKHLWAELRWCCDVAELARANPDMDWDACLARAARTGCRRMLAIGLLLAFRLLDAPVPAHIVRSIEADRAAADLAALAAARMFDPDSERVPPSGLSTFRFRMRERWRERMAYVARSTTTPTLEQVRRLPLPAGLRFLHYMIRPAVDWLIDPLRRAKGTASPRIECEAWSRRSEFYRRWADHEAEHSGWLSEQLLDKAQLDPHGTVLDLASGIGEPALRLARRAGNGGAVIGIDACREMLAVARDREAQAGIANLGLCVAAMEELPFAPASFDGVVCRFGITCAAQVERVLAGALRVLRRNRPAAFLVWGPRADNSLLDFTEKTLASFFGDGWAAPETATFRFSDPGLLASALRRAGFERIQEHELRRTEPVPDHPACWRAHYETAYGDLIGELPDSVQAALRNRLAERFEQLGRGGRSGWSTHARVVVGWKR